MTLTHNYLSVPRALILQLRDNVLAIGIYALIGRLYLVEQRAVPLSRGDLRQIDPALRVGAVARALDRLRAGGWLVAQPAGRKGHYQPTWGARRTGAPVPWAIGPRLGCPPHIERDLVRIDRRLIDMFIGRFRPHDHHATVARYVTAPLLGLADVGTYVRAHVLPAPPPDTHALRHWGLLDAAGAPQPIPDDAAVLALASQRASAATFQLTEAGWLRLGCLRPPTTQQAADGPVPLFFVPPERIGDLIPPQIGDVIGHADAPARPAVAAAREESALSASPPIMPGTPSESSDSRHPTPSPWWGGRSARHKKETPQGPAATALQALGVHPASVAELATLPAEQVARAVAYAAATPGISSAAGWVVDALRRHRDAGWTIPDPRPAVGQVDWGALVRAQAQERAAVAAALVEPEAAGAAETVSPHLADPTAPHAPPAPAALTAQVRALLRTTLPPADRPLAERLSVALERGTLRVTAAGAQLAAIRDRVLGALGALGADLGLAADTAVVVQAGVPLVTDSCPPWLDSTVWAQLPRGLRGLLSGTTCVQGRVVGVTPVHTQQLWDAAEALTAYGVVTCGSYAGAAPPLCGVCAARHDVVRCGSHAGAAPPLCGVCAARQDTVASTSCNHAAS